MASSPFIAGIYPILDCDWLAAASCSPPTIAQELARWSIGLVQLRCKQSAAEQYNRLAFWMELLRSQCPGMAILINDRVDLALALGADGVHVGQDDLPPAVCRHLLGRDKIIGLSTHTIAEVERGEQSGADYLGFGPIFSTNTKSDHQPETGLTQLTAACRRTALPVVAIGGIGLAQLPEVAATGAAAAAMISALFPAAATPQLADAVAAWRRTRG